MSETTKRFWVSWEEPVDETSDYRPRSWPLPPAIPHYWCSGYLGDGSAATLCAVVDAPSEEEAKQVVLQTWGGPAIREWRFVNAQEDPAWMPSPDRFPVKKPKEAVS